MLTDKAKLMILLNEASRMNQKAEALKLLFDCHQEQAIVDWASAYKAIEALLKKSDSSAFSTAD